MSAVADMDSRLEQIANQQRVTNGMLALLILTTGDLSKLSNEERTTIEVIARTAIRDNHIP